MGIHYKFNRGEIRRDDVHQVKKHHTQFTEIERVVLEHLLKAIAHGKVSISDHALNRLKTVSKVQVYDALWTGRVIEANVTRGEFRLLVRGSRTISIYDQGIKKFANICAVVDVKSGRVITIFLNESGDNHSSIDMSRYDATLDIMAYARV